jgi:hypothetical protein
MFLFLKKFDFIAFVNAGKMEISDNNLQLAAWKGFSEYRRNYLEIGGGIGRIFDIFRVNLAMRLNNINDRSWHRFYAGWFLTLRSSPSLIGLNTDVSIR